MNMNTAGPCAPKTLLMNHYKPEKKRSNCYTHNSAPNGVRGVGYAWG